MNTTYDRLYEIVSPHLKSYRNDLEKHDRETLKNWNGPFLYGYRPTGTSLIKLGLALEEWFPDMMYKPMFAPRYQLKDVDESLKVLEGELVWILPGADNKEFLHFDGKQFHKIDKERVALIWRNYLHSLKCSLPFKMQGSIAITI